MYLSNIFINFNIFFKLLYFYFIRVLSSLFLSEFEFIIFKNSKYFCDCFLSFK